MGFSRQYPGYGCTGRAARANTLIIGRAYACCASSALTDSVGAGQVTLSISRSRARMFCYETFTHPLSMASEGHGHRLLLLVLACVCRETRGPPVGRGFVTRCFRLCVCECVRRACSATSMVPDPASSRYAGSGESRVSRERESLRSASVVNTGAKTPKLRKRGKVCRGSWGPRPLCVSVLSSQTRQ